MRRFIGKTYLFWGKFSSKGKIVYPKYSKHWLYSLAATIGYVFSKALAYFDPKKYTLKSKLTVFSLFNSTMNKNSNFAFVLAIVIWKKTQTSKNLSKIEEIFRTYLLTWRPNLSKNKNIYKIHLSFYSTWDVQFWSKGTFRTRAKSWKSWLELTQPQNPSSAHRSET